MPNSQKLQFPKTFLWGASISAHQVEGGLHNQWTVWELDHAKVRAARASYVYGELDNWDSIKQAAKSPNNYVTGVASDHQSHYTDDITLARKLQLNALKFSIEWSRVEPRSGEWDTAAINYYKAYLAELKRQGIEPVVTLIHHTLPVWFAELGGLEKRANNRYVLRYMDKIMAEIGGAMRYVITFQEPHQYAINGYLHGSWPPGVMSHKRYRSVERNIVTIHKKAAAAIRERSRRHKVSIALRSSYVYAGDDAWLSVKAAQAIQYLHDDYLFAKLAKTCDFIGVSFMDSQRVYGYRVHNPADYVSDTGESMQPQHIEHALVRLSDKFKKPILITNNGVADVDDRYRKWWLMQTIIGMERARQKGAELLGYMYDSLIDGYDWDHGFWAATGLVAVDRQTLARTPRPSAIWLARTVKQLQRGAK